MSLTVSVDIKQHWTMLRHWSRFVPNMSPTSEDMKLYIIIIIIPSATEAILTYHWGKNEYWYGPSPSHVLLKTTNYSRNLASRIKAHHNEHRRGRGDKKISNGQGSVGHSHLLLFPRTLNLTCRFTVSSRLSCLFICAFVCAFVCLFVSIFSITRVALLVKQWSFLV